MREIKFKAWDIENKKMIPFNEEEEFFPTVWEMKFITGGFNSIQYRNMTDAEWVYGTDNVILMQYTGLKDKNGVEIYEKDIIQYKVNFTKEWFSNWRIDFGEYVNYNPSIEEKEMTKCYGFYLTNSYGHSKPLDYSFFEKNKFEAIGNIYENPELLKQ